MNAVGIDVSKGKSMVAALRPMGEVALLPQEFLHTEVGLEQMAYAIIALGENTRVIMEATGRYHEPVPAAPQTAGEVTPELVAAVSAALAEELGTDITGIRIVSMKKV